MAVSGGFIRWRRALVCVSAQIVHLAHRAHLALGHVAANHRKLETSLQMKAILGQSTRISHHARAKNATPNPVKAAHAPATTPMFGSGFKSSCWYASSAQACGVMWLICRIVS